MAIGSDKNDLPIPGPAALLLIVGGWAVIAVGGICAMAKYAGTPGPETKPQLHWPVSDRLPRPAGPFTLVMLVHPQCPCTRASINELERLLSRNQGKLNALIIFIEQPGLSADPKQSDLWSSARQIKGVKCLVDSTGDLAAGFNASTSGQIFLYDHQGVLQFSGGITASRGHAGDNDGEETIETIIGGHVPITRTTPVFGCSLR